MSADIFQKPKEDGAVFYGRLWRRLPKWMHTFIFLVIGSAICLVFAASVYAAGEFLLSKHETDSVSGCDSAEILFFSTFTKSGESCEWLGLDGLMRSQLEKNTFRPKISENFLGGRDIFFPIEMSPDFHAVLRFVPQNPEKVNVAINYGHAWRLIVGNGDYNQVVMQRNENPDKEDLGKHDWIDVPENDNNKWVQRNGRFDSRKEITVDIVSRSREGSRVIHVDATISGYIGGMFQKKYVDFDYDVETPGPAASLIEYVGVGFLDPYNEGIETKLIDFSLQRLDGLQSTGH